MSARVWAVHEPGAGLHAGGAEARGMNREWARYEAMLAAIQDPSSPEAVVARRAHRRLADIASELKLAGTGVVELANQVGGMHVVHGCTSLIAVLLLLLGRLLLARQSVSNACLVWPGIVLRPTLMLLQPCVVIMLGW